MGGPFFPDVHRSFKFAVLAVAGPQRRFDDAQCAFFQRSAALAEQNAFTLSPADFTAVNPNTGTAPIFRSRHDADITLGIYRRLPVLVDRRGAAPRAVWPVEYSTMFHMTNDSGLFRRAAELEQDGAYRVAPHLFRKGTDEWLPLYEGKMVQAYDHRAANVVVNTANLHRAAQPENATDEQHADPAWLPEPQYWLSSKEKRLPGALHAVIAFKDVTAPTNMRTMIAAFVPAGLCGNTLPLLAPPLPEPQDDHAGALAKRAWLDIVTASVANYVKYSPLLLGNLNSMALDFVARQKVQGQHLNFFIVEQLPVIPREGFTRKFGKRTAEQIVRDHVLRLTYTAHDMAPFAHDQGYDGAPFAWDEEERLHLRARLDALFFHLYGLSRDEADYIIGTFPIVAENERAQWGRCRSRDLILGYYNALAANDPDSRVVG